MATSWSEQDDRELARILGEFWPRTFLDMSGKLRQQVVDAWRKGLRAFPPTKTLSAIRQHYLDCDGRPSLPRLLGLLGVESAPESFRGRVESFLEEWANRHGGEPEMVSRSGARVLVTPVGLLIPGRGAQLWDRVSGSSKAAVEDFMSRTYVEWGSGMPLGGPVTLSKYVDDYREGRFKREHSAPARALLVGLRGVKDLVDHVKHREPGEEG